MENDLITALLRRKLPKDTQQSDEISSQSFRAQIQSGDARSPSDAGQYPDHPNPTHPTRFLPPTQISNSLVDAPADSSPTYNIETRDHMADMPPRQEIDESPAPRAEMANELPPTDTGAEELQCSPLQVLAEAVARHRAQSRRSGGQGGHGLGSPDIPCCVDPRTDMAAPSADDSGGAFVSTVRQNRLSRYFGRTSTDLGTVMRLLYCAISGD